MKEKSDVQKLTDLLLGYMSNGKVLHNATVYTIR